MQSAGRLFLLALKQAYSGLQCYQTILGNDGKPAFIVIPFADFIKLPGAVTPGMIPNAVVGRRIRDEISMLQAWGEYLMLTQADMAERMGITQAVTGRSKPPNVRWHYAGTIGVLRSCPI